MIRTSAFLRKEIVEVVRQPRLLLLLVLGPFLILLIFGGGLREDDPAVRTTFVVDPESPIAGQIQRFADAQDERLTVEGLTDNEEQALQDLRDGRLDLVVVVPGDSIESLRQDTRAKVTAFHNQLDPIEAQAVGLFTRTAVDEINQLILQQLVSESQSDAGEIQQRIDVARDEVKRLRESASPTQLRQVRGDLAALALIIGPTAALLSQVGGEEEGGLLSAVAGLDASADQLGTSVEDDQIDRIERDLEVVAEGIGEFRELSPSTIVSPFDGVSEQVVKSDIKLSDYYAPAVVALLLQHLVITFVSLSVVRERTLGTTELFQVAPMNTVETLIGKYAAYTILGGVLAVVLTGGLVFGLGVPFVGSIFAVTAVILLILVASIGIGFIFALLADSDSQAVQYAMLMLLASIFFSGFLLSLERFRGWVSWLAAPIPAAEGIGALRDVMLRGDVLTLDTLLHLGVLAVVFFGISWVMLHLRLRSR